MKIINFLIFLIAISSVNGQAQKSTSKTAVKPMNAPVPFKLKTRLGIYDNGSIVNVNEGRQLLGFPVKVFDGKNIPCSIISYNFMYHRKGLIEDEKSQKKQSVFTSVGDRFTSTPLPALWKDNIMETLQKGEELYFFDIIIKDRSGRRTFAPELKISIQ